MVFQFNPPWILPKKKKSPQEALRIAAEAHLRQCRCRNKAGEPWPLWATTAGDLQDLVENFGQLLGQLVKLQDLVVNG